MTPEQIRECREVLKDHLSRNQFMNRGKNRNDILQTALTTLDELEKKEAEIVRLKNRVDALLEGHAGDKGSVQLMGMRVKQLEAELERVRGYKNEIIDGIAKSALESREGGKEVTHNE